MAYAEVTTTINTIAYFDEDGQIETKVKVSYTYLPPFAEEDIGIDGDILINKVVTESGEVIDHTKLDSIFAECWLEDIINKNGHVLSYDDMIEDMMEV